MEHITYIGEVVEKLADHSSFPELFIKYEEGDPIPSGKACLLYTSPSPRD